VAGIIHDIVGLIKDEAITFEDVDEFSDELRDRVQRCLIRQLEEILIDFPITFVFN